MSVSRPVIRYHGGKWKLAPWIISHFPPHRVYVEPFGGGASVLMRKPRCYAEIYNDRWGDVVNVFRVMRDQGPELARLLYLTPFARDEFGAGMDSPDPLERARATVYRSFSGFGSASVNGEHSTGFRSNSNRSHTTPAGDWRNYPDCISAFVERLRGVVIENRDAIAVMQQHDSPTTLHYLDPPYVQSTRNMRRGNAAYNQEMSDEHHVELLDFIQSLRGMVVLSGYRCELYDAIPWRRVDRATYADGANARVESLWLNDAVSTFGQCVLPGID